MSWSRHVWYEIAFWLFIVVAVFVAGRLAHNCHLWLGCQQCRVCLQTPSISRQRRFNYFSFDLLLDTLLCLQGSLCVPARSDEPRILKTILQEPLREECSKLCCRSLCEGNGAVEQSLKMKKMHIVLTSKIPWLMALHTFSKHFVMTVCQSLGPRALVRHVPRPCCGRRHGTPRLKMPRHVDSWDVGSEIVRCLVFVLGGVDWVHSIFLSCSVTLIPQKWSIWTGCWSIWTGFVMINPPNSTKHLGCARSKKSTFLHVFSVHPGSWQVVACLGTMPTDNMTRGFGEPNPRCLMGRKGAASSLGRAPPVLEQKLETQRFSENHLLGLGD